MPPHPTRLALALVPIVLAATSLAPATNAATDVDLRSFRPSTDTGATLATEPVSAPLAGVVQLGGWFSFATTTLRAQDANDPLGATQRTVVGPQLVFDPTFAIGLGRRTSVGVTVPVLLAQGGDAASVTDGVAPSSQGIGDLALTGKLVLHAPGREQIGGLAFAALARVTLPTGDRASFLSDRGTQVDARLLASWDYAHTIVATGVLGYRLRTRAHTLSDVTLDDGIPWGFTLGLKPVFLSAEASRRWTWNLEAHGEIGTGERLLSDSRVSPVLLGASARYELGSGLSLFAGAETSITAAVGAPRFRGVLALTFAPKIVDDDDDGVPDDKDECPGLPEDGLGAHPHDGCPDDSNAGAAPTATPSAPDADGDGVPDAIDKCPKDPETINGYEDDDGCPEPDRDGDTFLDAVDRCPDAPETFDGIDDEDGCPDTPAEGRTPAPRVTEKRDPAKGPDAPPAQLVLAQPIAFEADGQPARASIADLRALAAWLLAHPGLRVTVAVAPEGDGEAARETSKARAKALALAIVRYAHTGGVAVDASWDASKAAGTSNVQVLVEATSSDPPPP
jgi:hypothetical protein